MNAGGLGFSGIVDGKALWCGSARTEHRQSVLLTPPLYDSDRLHKSHRDLREREVLLSGGVLSSDDSRLFAARTLCTHVPMHSCTHAPRERGSNVSIRGVELAGSAADYPRQWNRCTGNWLRFYCYERIAPPGRRGLVSPFAALLITQLLSGFWHGLFAGYFLFFATSILMLQASKEIFRIQRTLPAGLPTIAGKAFHTLVSAFHLAYSAAVFVALFWEPSIACWRSLKFSGHISMLVLIAVGTALPKPRRAKGEKKAE